MDPSATRGHHWCAVQTLTSTSGQGDSIDEENLDDNDDADDECYDSTTDNDDEHRAPWVIVWDLFCVCCVLRGVNITLFPLRFHSCDIRLTSYSIQNPHSYISSASTRTKLRGSREKESQASAGRTRGKRKVKLTWAQNSLCIKYSLSGWNISHTWKKENFKLYQF